MSKGGSVVSLVNRKGGVGKTTLSIALAETLVFEHRANVALLDFDPQSSASDTLLAEDHYLDCLDRGKTFAGHLASILSGEGECSISSVVQRARHSLLGRGDCDLAILPNGPDLWEVEWETLRSRKEGEHRDAVRAVIAHFKANYDYVLIDCPPGRTISSEVAILNSGLVLCPVVPERLAVWGMDRMKQYFDELSEQHVLPKWRFVVSRSVGNTREGQRALEDIKNRFQEQLLTEKRLLGAPEVLAVPRSERIVQRIALFREAPDTIKTLDGFYGDVSRELKRIARVVERDLERNG